MTTFVWLTGKPGSGKTTIGNFLAKHDGILHFSSGALLREVQPSPGPEGYSTQDREKVFSRFIKAHDGYDAVIVDGNPYSEMERNIVKYAAPFFDPIYIINLTISDEKALARLTDRKRDVPIHDGASQEDRIHRFNAKLQPVIEELKQYPEFIEIDVGDSNSEAVAEKIRTEILGRA